MKKKVLLIVLLIVAIIVIGIIAFLYIYLNTSNGISKSKLEEKGYQVFGYDYCTTDHSFEGGGDAFTEWQCKICGKTAMNPDTNVPVICNNCARITNRCNKCGKLEK